MLKSLVASAVAAATIGGGSAAFVATSPASGRAAAPASSTAVLTASTSVCDTDANWPAYVQGRPYGFDPGDDGVYIWHNPTGGWGLRVSHPILPGGANRVVFTGTVTSQGSIGHVVRVRDERDDAVWVGPDGHTLFFRFADYGGVDGVDFTTTCTPGLRFDLRADGGSMAPAFIHLGDMKVHPGSDPFLVRRVDTDTGTSPA
jgi:hypothetical protein